MVLPAMFPRWRIVRWFLDLVGGRRSRGARCVSKDEEKEVVSREAADFANIRHQFKDFV